MELIRSRKQEHLREGLEKIRGGNSSRRRAKEINAIGCREKSQLKFPPNKKLKPTFYFWRKNNSFNFPRTVKL
jgi:hypothetical protein